MGTAQWTDDELRLRGVDVDVFRDYFTPNGPERFAAIYGQLPPTEPDGTMWMASPMIDLILLSIEHVSTGLATTDFNNHARRNDALPLSVYERRWRWSRNRVRRLVESIRGTAPTPIERVRSGLVYVIGRADGIGPVKVGFTTTAPAKRLAALQCGNPHRLVVIGSIIGTADDERAIHVELSTAHVLGEWFERGPAMARMRARGMV